MNLNLLSATHTGLDTVTATFQLNDGDVSIVCNDFSDPAKCTFELANKEPETVLYDFIRESLKGRPCADKHQIELYQAVTAKFDMLRDKAYQRSFFTDACNNINNAVE